MRTGIVRKGFTLIEMLVVIAIILILSGIILRATSLVFRNMATGKAHHDLQQIQNALNEYYAEYGNYPPCSYVAYEYEGDLTRLNPAFRTYLANPLYNNPDDPSRFFLDTDARPSGSWPQGTAGKSIGYRYGLISYLWPRDKGQSHWYDADTERDKTAKARWAGFLKDVKVESGWGGAHVATVESTIAYTNTVDNIPDPWRREYQYVCKPPYQSYRLWSFGLDGIDGTADDINADSKK